LLLLRRHHAAGRVAVEHALAAKEAPEALQRRELPSHRAAPMALEQPAQVAAHGGDVDARQIHFLAGRCETELALEQEDAELAQVAEIVARRVGRGVVLDPQHLAECLDRREHRLSATPTLGAWATSGATTSRPRAAAPRARARRDAPERAGARR